MTADNALNTPWSFHFMKRGKGRKESKGSESENAGTAGDYSSSIKHLSTVSTISEFWSTYDYMLRPSALVATTDYHMFRGGISPTWEDEANEKGGKWVVRVRKGLSSQYFEWLIFALIGETLAPGFENQICGIVVSVRGSEDIISIWNRDRTDREAVDRIREGIRKVCQLPSWAFLEYKPHQTSLADKPYRSGGLNDFSSSSRPDRDRDQGDSRRHDAPHRSEGRGGGRPGERRMGGGGRDRDRDERDVGREKRDRERDRERERRAERAGDRDVGRWR